jgi:hypothetical protein
VRPTRPCPFCEKMQNNLSRHILTRHRKNEQVLAMLSLPQKEQLKELQLLKKQGIWKENLKRMKSSEFKQGLLRERKQNNCNERLQMCSKCSGFYERSLMYKHLKKCSAVSVNSLAEAITFHTPSTTSGPEHEQFTKDILSSFRSDDIGHLCKTDPMITTVGRIMWERTGKKKTRCVTGEMRKLGCLLHKAKSTNDVTISGQDLLIPENFRIVVEALNAVVSKVDEKEKCGLKVSLGYLLKKAAKFTKCEFIIVGNDEEVRKRENFLTLLDGSWGHMMFNAEAEIESNREACNRRPRNLPAESDVQKLRNFVLGRISDISADIYNLFGSAEYVELRWLLVSRLTLFNARRGGEPARLLLKEWNDAEINACVSPEMIEHVIDPLEQALLSQYKLAYQRGKGSRKMVPILIPSDIIPAIRKLVEQRIDSGVMECNPYLFATIKSEDGHADGWQCINTACLKANISDPTKLTATKIRHRASTYHALQDIPENEKKAFYQHMGHSRNINETVYQCPPSVLEITKVGNYLTNLDRGRVATSKVAAASHSKHY